MGNGVPCVAICRHNADDTQLDNRPRRKRSVADNFGDNYRGNRGWSICGTQS